MAECKIPVRIDGYKCVEDMIQDVLNYTYKGKTLKEWANSISEPHTNADKIRAMSDEELAEWMATKTSCMRCPVDLDACHNFEFSDEMSCEGILLSWLKAPVEVDG